MIDWLTSQFGFSCVLMAVLIGVIMTTVAYCIYFERKISAYMQDRVGPNRVGPVGLLQPLADGLKFLLKEDITPARVDRGMFLVAPVMMFIVSLIGFAVIPWGGVIELGGKLLEMQVASIDVGLLYIVAVASMGVYGVVLGAWASNNKYSFFGGMRAAAQMLSYEVPLGLGILVVVMTAGEVRLENIATVQQQTTWFVVLHPVAFLMVFVAQLAEANRMPFDLAEAEQELVGGYHTEYSSMKFALFFLAEYAHMITGSAFLVVMFLGSWELVPFSGWLAENVSGFAWLGAYNESTNPIVGLLRFGVVFGKIAVLIFVSMWIRWTLPRFRYDQLMRLAWRGLVPIGMVLFALVCVLIYFNKATSWWALLGNVAIVLILVVSQLFASGPITGRQESLQARGRRETTFGEPA